MTKQAGFLIGLIGLLLGTSACDSIIEIVPLETPTPVAVSQTSTDSTTTNHPNRIAVEAIDLDAPVVEMGWYFVEQWGEQVSEWNMPDDEAAWHKNSARPGEGSNIVISGHNESAGGQVFADLEELQIGDEITLWNENQETFVYQLVEKNIVRIFAGSAEVQAYLQTVTEPTSKEQLTLITCWPRWSNTHRLIVIAEPK